MMAVIQPQNLLLPLDLSCDSADNRSLEHSVLAPTQTDTRLIPSAGVK